MKGAKRRGRPPSPDTVELVRLTIRLPKLEHKQLEDLGGSILAKRILLEWLKNRRA